MSRKQLDTSKIRDLIERRRSACKSFTSTNDTSKISTNSQTEYTEPQPIDVTKAKDGGVLKTILKPGTQLGVLPSKGDIIFVHYTGVFKDSGKKFEDSRARDKPPFCFSLGYGQMVKGWDLAVATMCPGEIARIECRPDYAYGAKGLPPKIPGNQTLVFEVEVLRFEGEDSSQGRDGTICETAEGKNYGGYLDDMKSKTVELKAATAEISEMNAQTEREIRMLEHLLAMRDDNVANADEDAKSGA